MSSKYKNKRCRAPDGTWFDSQKEMRRYGELRMRMMAGEIRGLECQPRRPLIISGVPLVSDSGRQLYYVGDFAYVEEVDGRRVEVIEDVKGMKTDVYKLKKAIMRAMGITIRET